MDDDKRGRVMSLYTMALMGMAPFGSILGGALAHRIGVPATFMLGGTVSIAGAVPLRHPNTRDASVGVADLCA